MEAHRPDQPGTQAPFGVGSTAAAGWKNYLYGDPKPADALILKDNPEMSQDILDQARQKMREKGIVLSGDATTQGIGAMSDARWATFFGIASSQNVYPKTMDPRSAYSLQFLPAAPAAK